MSAEDPFVVGHAGFGPLVTGDPATTLGSCPSCHAPLRMVRRPYESNMVAGCINASCSEVVRPAKYLKLPPRDRYREDNAVVSEPRPAADAVCIICDGGPGNECACNCGMRSWDKLASGDFSIGGTLWPGLSKLIEEVGELQQVAGKLIQVPSGDHWSGDLRKMFVEEIGDVLAAVRFFMRHNDFDPSDVEERAARKLQQFEIWHRETQENRRG